MVGSAKSREEAQIKIREINSQDPSLKLRIGPRACDSDFYPVFASDYLPIDDARSLLLRARKVVPDAYLSPGPR